MDLGLLENDCIILRTKIKLAFDKIATLGWGDLRWPYYCAKSLSETLALKINDVGYEGTHV